ncbi:MAG: choice-of-anchor L domain-containing protein [Lewinellaceae bacterium]|nr:choice-of-anchor L domain-containing protein [Lewinellaceae bacterium]
MTIWPAVINGAAGNVTLNGLIPGYTTHDACMLEFDLEAIGKEVTFDYVWASEEYEEYLILYQLQRRIWLFCVRPKSNRR